MQFVFELCSGGGAGEKQCSLARPSVRLLALRRRQKGRNGDRFSPVMRLGAAGDRRRAKAFQQHGVGAEGSAAALKDSGETVSSRCRTYYLGWTN